MRTLGFLFLAFFLSLPLAAATADLGVQTSAFPPLVLDPGEQFRFTVTVFWNGPDPAERAQLALLVPEGTRVVGIESQFGTCVQQANTIVCDAPAATRFTSATTFTLQAPAHLGGTLGHITARVSSDTPDPKPDNDTLNVALTTRRLFVVQSDADDGADTLRRHIETMNATCGGEPPCKIVFAREMTIEPRTPLPAITACNSAIDGGGASGAPMRVQLLGTQQRAGDGLTISTACTGGGSFARDGVTIHRLAVGGFPGNGIYVITPVDPAGIATRHVIEEAYVGTDIGGTVARPNGLRGVATDAPGGDVTIALSTLSGNVASGIAFWRVRNANVLRNRIGIGTDGRPLPNGASGLFAAFGDVSATSNEIAHNRQFGISTIAANVVNQGNVIRDNGELPVDLGLDGPSRAGALRPPLLLDATYDPATNRTTVRGRLIGNNELSEGGTFHVRFGTAAAPNARGFVDLQTFVPSAGVTVFPNRRGAFDRDFEAVMIGDLRGQLIVGFTSYAPWPDLLDIASSELSDGVAVH